MFDEPIPLDPLILLQEGPDDSGSGGPSPITPESPAEGLLEEYADLAAAENSCRVPARSPVGWSSWYQYFANLQWEDIEKNLRLARGVFPFTVFQVDDGFEKDIGDWLMTKEGFRPLPELARLVESDDLALVDAWGRELLRKAIALQGGKVRVRGLMNEDFYRIESAGGGAGDVLLLANLSDQQRVYRSTEVSPRSARIILTPANRECSQ